MIHDYKPSRRNRPHYAHQRQRDTLYSYGLTFVTGAMLGAIITLAYLG